MCVINFEIVVIGTSPAAAEGRYRANGASTWIEFPVTLGDMKTPDININGNYELQIRVQYPDSTYSEWTPSSLFKVGNCNKLGNLYSTLSASNTCPSLTRAKYTNVFFSSNAASGSPCYDPMIGDSLYIDSDLTTPVPAGEYATYAVFNGCTPEVRVFAINVNGKINSTNTCSLNKQ